MIDTLQPYPEYKESGLPWLGNIPAHWEIKRAKSIFHRIDQRSKTGKEELLTVSSARGIVPRKTVFHHFLSPEDWAWLRTFGDADLCPEEARALVYAREIGAVDNATYRHLNRVDVLNASTHLRRLRDRTLLEQKGKGSETYYIPTERLLAPWRKLQGNALATDVITVTASQIAPDTPPQSSKSGTQSSKGQPQTSKAAFPDGIQSVSGRNPVTAQDNMMKANKLQILAEVLGRPAAQVTAQVAAQVTFILGAVAYEPKNREDIQSAAGITHREHFRNFYVDPLIEAGWLERTVPEKPTSRLQKYRLTDKGHAWLAATPPPEAAL